MSETKKGGIRVETQHIFPIIKRWLYSDKEIFLRELVSNASDAITKMKRLVSLGEISDNGEAYRIDVKLDEENKTLTVSDNGIGMSEDEVERYINQIALSGALEFIEKYEKESDNSGIIGHFGLGFYSAFMVADKVEIITKSFTDAPAVHWVCNEVGEFEMEKCEKAERGTDIILHITEEEKDFLKKETLMSVLDKYCAFMPTEIYFNGEEKPINDTNPLWLKNPSECKKEDYIEFYRKVFFDFQEPLFYIHINADYPLNFKGILFFPKPSHEFSNMEGQVKLYYNQVFVADNIKEVIPEYLLTLRGVLDCPELPLNVSRSYLQNSGYVSKISAHIVKKVADKINSLFNTEREAFEKMWDDLKPFVEYGSMRDKKFLDKVRDSVIFKKSDDTYVTLKEYTDKNTKEAGKVFYANDKVQQSRYISLLKEEEIDVLLLDSIIDSQFITHLESENKDIKFVRCDSDIASSIKSEGDLTENEVLKELFKEAINKESTEVSFTSLKNAKTPAMITLDEQNRRFSDMMKLYRMGDMPTENNAEKLVVNVNNPLVEKISSLIATDREKAKSLAKEVYMFALISHRSLSEEELENFVDMSVDLLTKM